MQQADKNPTDGSLQAETAPPGYTVGFSEEMLATLMQRSAENSATHLLPHLKPGMRVLDFGCGPGSISAGLAQAVAPGEVHGIDAEETQVELAKTVSAALQVENTTFHVGDVTDMPFEDGFFDAAHGSDILLYVPDTQAALSELKRVLKPGGVIGCREFITASSFTYPDTGIFRRAWEMFEDVISTDDGHPQMGMQLNEHLVKAGFADVRISASFDLFSTPEEIDVIYKVASDWFLSPEFTALALEYGATSVQLIEDIRKAYVEWRSLPGALCGLAFGQAVAYKRRDAPPPATDTVPR